MSRRVKERIIGTLPVASRRGPAPKIRLLKLVTAVCAAVTTVGGTTLPPESLSTNERVEDWIDSLKVAVTVVLVATPVAFGAGVSAVTVGGVVERLRALEWQPDFLTYVYVVDDEKHEQLLGIVSLRDLVMADPETPVAAIMEPDIKSTTIDEDASHVARLMAEYNLVALPVPLLPLAAAVRTAVAAAVAQVGSPAAAVDVWVDALAPATPGAEAP